MSTLGIQCMMPVMPPNNCDPVGSSDIAERLGVAEQTVKTWKLRGVLPPPRWTVSGRPCWNWADIAKWASETGRATKA